MRVKHRSDIDGLRAVAVLPVLAFHLDAKQTPGGFVGVDVFFVISGFLIGSIILSEISGGVFSISAFYVRRFRRILPALFFMLIVTTVACLWLLYPIELAAYAHSLLGAVFSYSNVYFFLNSGYFQAPSSALPLLHTWSLAVEEQFYIALPLMLLLLRGLRRTHLRWVLGLIALASLALSVHQTRSAPDAAFYLLPSRAWELLLGTLVGMFAAPGSRRVREAMAAAGLALIVASVLLLDEHMPFPGLAAIPPCVGAAMIIWAGRLGPTAAGRLLSVRPVAFVGLVSYSLYLWHWPLIVLYKLHLGRGLAASDKVMLFAAAFALAVFSWWFVERPFRDGRFGAQRIFAYSGAGAGGIGAIAVLAIALGGLPQRFPPKVARLAAYLAPPTSSRAGACFINSNYTFSDFRPDICLRRTPARPSILLVGDSHADHLYFGLARVFPEADVMQATASGCKPVIRAQRFDETRCRQLIDWVFNNYLGREKVDVVVLSARWRRDDLDELRETLRWARKHGVRLAVSGPIVEYASPLPRLLATEARTGQTDLATRRLVAETAEMDIAVERMVKAEAAPYGSAYRALCVAHDCQHNAPDGAPVQFDYGHLTHEGSVLVVSRLAQQGLFNGLPGYGQPTAASSGAGPLASRSMASMAAAGMGRAKK